MNYHNTKQKNNEFIVLSERKVAWKTEKFCSFKFMAFRTRKNNRHRKNKNEKYWFSDFWVQSGGINRHNTEKLCWS